MIDPTTLVTNILPRRALSCAKVRGLRNVGHRDRVISKCRVREAHQGLSAVPYTLPKPDAINGTPHETLRLLTPDEQGLWDHSEQRAVVLTRIWCIADSPLALLGSRIAIWSYQKISTTWRDG